jgi:16S rRNA (adenine1518-N6/adenine1519-N6)-dimethyltransferase
VCYNIRVPRRLGQHFLAPGAWRQRILRALAPEPDDVWLEIGAGHGEITAELARLARRVIAVELDPSLVAALRALAASHPGITVAAGDILALDSYDVTRGERARVYGNLPYYITSPILRRLFEFLPRIADIHVVVQYEVAARVAARPGSRDYGFLSALAQLHTCPEIVFRIPPGAFRPPPRVASALLRMKPRQGTRVVPDESLDAFVEFLSACFARKRKTLLNNLKAQYGAQRVVAAIAARRLPPSVRAEELSLEQFAALFRALVS